MTLAKAIPIISVTFAAAVFGFWINQTSNTKTQRERTQRSSIDKAKEPTVEAPYITPQFSFAQPFEVRKELDAALSLVDTTERYGRLMAIGYYAAQESPAQNLETLAPEIWDFPNYDLRGAFHAEWMRSDPETFLLYAEAQYLAFEQTDQLKLFPVFHLAYLEPLTLLSLLPQVEYPALQKRIRSELLSTLVELAPDLLWERRSEIASPSEIINAASAKGLFDQALQFWQKSGWEEISFYDELFSYMAENQRMDFAAQLQGYQKTRFVTFYALEHPAAAALWVRSQETLYDFQDEFTQEHASFFSKLFATETFSAWSGASAWITESLAADFETNNIQANFAIVKACPEACVSRALKESFRDYLEFIEDNEPIKGLYLSAENDHPILEVLEQFMLQSAGDFQDAIAARATREAPTPERLMQVLALGNLASWPDEYFSAARDTLNSLGDEELLWSLSPSMILAAQELSPERIQNIVSQADPTWLNNSLKHWDFIKNVGIGQLDSLSKIVQYLPEKKAQTIINSARENLFRRSVHAENKADYLQIARTQNEVLLVASGINRLNYQSDPNLQTLIKKHPYREDIFLEIAINSQANEFSDPDLKNAAERIKNGLELAKKDPSEIVSTLHSLPTSERFIAAKATLLSRDHDTPSQGASSIVNLPIWNDSEREQLKNLIFKDRTNYNVSHHSNLVW